VDVKDVVIIGAGPSGIATAIQLKRYNIEPVLLEQEGIGGAIITLEEMPGDTTYTSSNGSFRIEKVPGKIGELVRVYVYKEGYKMRNEYHELPGPARIMLEKQ